jgi:hypothetical protein
MPDTKRQIVCTDTNEVRFISRLVGKSPPSFAA